MMKKFKPALLVALLGLFGASAVSAENIRLRIASGHPAVNTYVNLMQNFFVPEVSKRVAARTQHKVEFVEGYGGSMVKVADTLEGVQSGLIDIGGYCFCFEASNLPLNAFQVMLPFGTMIALISDNGYNIGTTFEWNNISDLKGKKIAGAGLNLKWLEYAGVTPVQSTLPDGYTALQTGVYAGWIMFPSAWVNFKFYEVAKNYTEVGFGAITWHGLTINKNRMAKLPKDVQAIIIEVAKEFEAKTGSVNQENYPKQIAQLKTLGVNVKSVPDSVKLDWANSLKDWPQAMASDLDARGMPGSLVLKTTLEEAEKMGHKWPVRYVIK